MRTRTPRRPCPCEHQLDERGKTRLIWGSFLLALLLIPATLPAQDHECEFVAFLAQGGGHISDVISDSETFTYFLKNSSTPPNDDGYGVIYYNDNLEVSQSQKFFVTGISGPGNDGFCYSCGEMAVMDAAIAAIQDVNNHARIVFGHDRNGTGGVGNHPFTYEWNGRTYTFQQNGALSSDGTESMKSRIFNGLYYQGWFEQFPPGGPFGNWSGNPNNVNSWIDSELFFHFLMTYVIDAEGDVVAGLRAALSEQDFGGCDIQADITTTDPNANPRSVINFVFSDGESLFAFRNSYMTDPAHELSYRQFPGGLAGIWTQSGYGSHAIDRYQLAILPPSGSVILFDDIFTHPNGILEAKTYHKGSNWVCFPVLPTNSGPTVADFFSPLSHGNLVQSMNVQHEYDQQAVWDGFDWTQGNIGPMISTKGYKLNILEGSYERYQHLMVGEQRIAPNTQLTLHAGKNYVPYFLMESQHPSAAFPQHVLDVMTSIEGEHWFLIRRNGQFVSRTECGPVHNLMECYTLEYGAMYQVTVSSPVSFRWNQPDDPTYPYEKPLTVYYEPEKMPDYKPVVIEQIENGELIVEIAAIKDGVCVGAEAVEGYPVHLQVYLDDLSGVTYEAVSNDGIVQLASASDQTARTGARRSIVPSGVYHENGAVFMSMRQGAVEPFTTPSGFRIVSAYPNPFNPTTTLRIQLSRDMRVSLGIFNLQGQQVARLVDGELQAGEHELTWSGQADNGAHLASGMYYGVLVSGAEQSVQKLLMIK